MIVAIEQVQGVGYQPAHGPARPFPGYGDAEAVERIAKSQRVRVADVVLIGPLMVWGGSKLAPRYPVAGGLLALFGVATVLYNAHNYAIVRDALRAERAG